ncbi:glycerate kinase [Maribacter sp. 2-571]|uniref:glycerate kinase n=1 Tax=Maribacter sp. 2-571 TaxID=3417569 RepID=UPI003D32E7FB
MDGSIRFLLAPDKFKGSLTAMEVVSAVARGLKTSHGELEVHTISASDGGDGFLTAIAEQLTVERIGTKTVDPLGRTIDTYYLWHAAHKTAYIELANSAGLELLSDTEKSALTTTTKGTGEQIKHALTEGAEKIYVGLGGSATNDAGMGIASCFGYRFLDAKGTPLAPIGSNLGQIAQIVVPQAFATPNNVAVFAVNDVNNPLYGPTGAAYTYAAQKGADTAEIEQLDLGLHHFSKVAKACLHTDFSEVKGAGAAGGTAYGLQTFLGAVSISGTDFMLQLTETEKLLESKRFDYIITGEGKFDLQTLHGKWIKGMVDLGKKFNVPVIAICGVSDLAETEWRKMGLHEVLQVKTPDMTVAYSMQHAERLVSERIQNYFDTTVH